MNHPHHQSSPVAPLLGLLVIACVMGVLLYTMGENTFETSPKKLISPNQSTTSTIFKVYAYGKPNQFGAWYTVDVTHGSSTKEIDDKEMDGGKGVLIEDPEAPGSAPLVSGDGWRVALRDASGSILRDPRILGFRSDKEVYVWAHGAYPSVFLVKRDGGIHELLRLSDTQSVLGENEKGIWIVDRIPKEGIESPAHGPSSLWFVSVQDGIHLCATSSEEIISVVGDTERFAWSSGENMHIHTPKEDVVIQYGTPMNWIGEAFVFWKRVSEQDFLVSLWSAERGVRTLVHTEGIPQTARLLSGSDL